MDAPTLTVSAKRDGFRRAGRAWSIAPQTAPLADFSDEQLDALAADPGLVVVRGGGLADGDEMPRAIVEGGPAGLEALGGAPGTVTVVAKRDGFRRAGRAWSTAPQTVPLTDFSAEQLDAMRTDPGLVVVEGGTPTPAHSEGAMSGRTAGRDETGAPGASAEVAGTDEAEAGVSAQAERHAAIVAAIAQVGPEGRTKTGVPKVDALEAVVGGDVTGAERDAAWAEHLQGGEAA